MQHVASALALCWITRSGGSPRRREKRRPPASSQQPAPSPHPWERAVWDAGPGPGDCVGMQLSPSWLPLVRGLCQNHPAQLPHTPSPQKPRERRDVRCGLRPLRFGAVCRAAIERCLLQPIGRPPRPGLGSAPLLRCHSPYLTPFYRATSTLHGTAFLKYK